MYGFGSGVFSTRLQENSLRGGPKVLISVWNISPFAIFWGLKKLHLALEGCAQIEGNWVKSIAELRFGHTPLRPNEGFSTPQKIASGLMFHTPMGTFGPPQRQFSCRRVEKSPLPKPYLRPNFPYLRYGFESCWIYCISAEKPPPRWSKSANFRMKRKPICDFSRVQKTCNLDLL